LRRFEFEFNAVFIFSEMIHKVVYFGYTCKLSQAVACFEKLKIAAVSEENVTVLIFLQN